MLKAISQIFKFGSRSQKLDVESRFEINKVPFRGGTSVVHRATDKQTGQRYALKLTSPKRVAAFRDRFSESFDSEGEIHIKCAQANILKVIESGMTTNDQPYLLMEYVNAPTLDRFISGEIASKLPNRVAMIHQLARALFTIHQNEFIHRDICPRNLFVTNKLEQIKLFDFGLAIPNSPSFNTSGNRSGTPEFMAPEIVRRKPTDHRADIFALGVTAYQLLTYKHPWGTVESDSKSALIHDSFPVTDIREHRPDLHSRWVKAIHKCLETNPDNRMPSMKVFIAQTADIKREAA